MSDMMERIARIIGGYDGQGWHRTGTETDRQSAEWLAGLVHELGIAAEMEPFPLTRIRPLACYVESDGTRIEGLPLFDSSFTDAAGIEGDIGPAGSDAAIGLVDAPPTAPAQGPLADARRAGAHRAVVTVTRGRRPGLALINAEQFSHPYGPPVVQVADDAGAWLAEQAARRTPVRIVAQIKRVPAEAFNVTATVVGSDGGLAPLVVMTPRSGWWHCASERGGGLVCWLEIMRAVCERGAARTVHFLAGSGHELGHLGLEAYIVRRPHLPTAALAWIHFGANIGAADESTGAITAADDDLEHRARSALQAAGVEPVAFRPRGTAPGGEAHNIHARGGRYLSLIGSNALFHLESDRWPHAVDAGAVAAYASAFVALVTELTQP